LFTQTLSFGQNLVPNSGFEAFSSCPEVLNELIKCSDWFEPTTGTPDYFNECASPGDPIDVPNNIYGNQNARTDNAYTGIWAFSYDPTLTPAELPYREYATVKLTQTLVPGNIYAVKFYLNQADASNTGIQDIGAFFTTTIPTAFPIGSSQITGVPQVSNGATFINDKSAWIEISGCFQATDAYDYLTIGNFTDDDVTTYTNDSVPASGKYKAYYYIDDVSVVELVKPLVDKTGPFCGPQEVTVTNYPNTPALLWSNDDVGGSHWFDATETFTISITQSGCVVTSDPLTITILEIPDVSLGADVEFEPCLEGPYELSTFYLDPANVTYLWSTKEITETIEITEGGLYNLTVTATNGCSNTDDILFYNLCDGTVFAPNAFTPNGDGMNDIFEAHVYDYVITDFYIFNSRGRKIHHLNNGTATWDGGNKMDGVYIWVIEYEQDIPERYLKYRKTGHLTLLK